MKRQDNKTHYVFVADEAGMSVLFVQLKDILAGHPGCHVSLVYYSSGSFIFRKELEVLNRHFNNTFIVYYETAQHAGDSHVQSETLEIILNSNTMNTIRFTLAGDDLFVAETVQQLHFLGINDPQILNNNSNEEIHLINNI